MGELTGRCQCGAAAFRCTAPIEALYVCHCLECRRQSASAFGISARVRADAVTLIRGEVRTWTRPTDSGGTLDCVFCTQCGSRLWHRPAPGGRHLTIKGGTLDLELDLSRATEIWTDRRLGAVRILSECESFRGEPP